MFNFQVKRNSEATRRNNCLVSVLSHYINIDCVEISDSFLSKEQELKESSQEISNLKEQNSALLQKQREL